MTIYALVTFKQFRLPNPSEECAQQSFFERPEDYTFTSVVGIARRRCVIAVLVDRLACTDMFPVKACTSITLCKRKHLLAKTAWPSWWGSCRRSTWVKGHTGGRNLTWTALCNKRAMEERHCHLMMRNKISPADEKLRLAEHETPRMPRPLFTPVAILCAANAFVECSIKL